MYVPFKDLDNSSKLWVYQSNRIFTEKEIYTLEIGLREFVENWTAHNKELRASFEVKHGLFVVLAVDERGANATGCSIDRSVNFLKVVEREFKVDLFDRMNFTFQDQERTRLVSKSEFAELLQSGEITEETIVFNTLVQNVEQYRNQFKIPLAKSWHKTLFASSL